jgi:SH3-like domain-containing protein
MPASGSCRFAAFFGFGAGDDAAAFRSTELPLPRFCLAALRRKFTCVQGRGSAIRSNGSTKRAGFLSKSFLSFDIWRKIKDYDGQVGWVHHTMLSGKRTAFIKKGEARRAP